ncbi:sensor histidine kinase [Flavobacterium sp. CLA17]|uniref:sensor histidine kinase n=1 Tax=Flavobacterium sp. CLA17 TaxID=2724135 RepID=UPI001492DECA|nr:sensor histidine kinase [Flavobacterium sp. CLA17]QSB25354.1 sensor histidine kinase [Flavobacterium sp. CLA17]
MKQFFTSCLFFLFAFSSFAQIPSVAKYDLPKKRLLIQACSMYLYSSNQGLIDNDSAVVLTCKAYKFPLLLAYDEGYNDGSKLAGSELIEKGDIKSANRLLASLKGVDRLKLLYQLSNFYIFKSGAKPADLENAKIYIDQAVELSGKLKIKKWELESLMLLGKYYFQIKNMPESRKCFMMAVEGSRKLNDKNALAYALNTLSIYMSPMEPEKLKVMQELLALYKELKNKEKLIEAEMRMTVIIFWSGKLDEAKKIMYRTLIDMRSINFKHEQYTEATLVFIEIEERNLNAALYYALKSVKRMDATKDYTFADIHYRRLGSVYGMMGYNQEAIDLFKKSISFSKENKVNSGWYKAFLNACRALASEGKYKEALQYLDEMTAEIGPANDFEKMSLNFIKATSYDNLRNDALAEKYFKEMALFAEKLNSKETFRDVVYSYTAMAFFYAKRNDARNAKLITDKIKAITKENKYNFDSDLYQYSLYKIDSISGDYRSSLGHFQSYKRMYDSLANNSKNKQIEELKIQYETLNKEQKIKLQESELKKSQLLNTVSIWSLVLLLLVIGLLFNRYRLKQRTNSKLELKEKEINQKNINLGHLLDEKEWLLKEVHHRVKNNLQTVISLLNSQSAYLDNDKALSAIRNSQHRIHSMSLIHQKLYGTENIATINMPSYIKELVAYLKESFSLGQRIRFEVKVDPLELDVSQAVPLGLILNEAITNSIKYAFPNDAAGFIYVSLEASANDKYLMKISDNGIGIDTDFTDVRADSFGMSLIKGLTDDLEGNFSMENNNGTILKIEFVPELPIDRKYEAKPEIDSENP